MGGPQEKGNIRGPELVMEGRKKTGQGRNGERRGGEWGGGEVKKKRGGAWGKHGGKSRGLVTPISGVSK